MKKGMLILLILAFVLAVLAAVFYYWPTLKNNLLSSKTVELANIWRVENLACSYKTDCSEISFRFSALEGSLSRPLQYTIREIPEEAKTEIIFEGVREVNGNFDYEEIVNSPLIEDINQEQINDALILTIKRKGELTPIIIDIKDNIATIKIPADNDAGYPKFSEMEPADNSTVSPSWQKIKTRVILNSPLEKGILLIDNQAAPLEIKDMGFNQYLFEATQKLNNEQDYQIKAIAIDAQKRASAQTWEFGVQKSLAKKILGDDRFKYLGWWGQINSTSTTVMSAPSSTSTKLATFSTINRVKVLKEVAGETIGQNDLWLQIDGGAHPGAYIFSEYVTPIEQPKPPANFEIPEGVKEGEQWIDVDITKKILTLFEYDKPIFATYAAVGLPGSPTRTGIYRVWYKLVKTRMRGGPPVATHFYDLPNVPYVMYYNGSYAVHGTYWHDKFGTRQSAGCTNLTQGDAKYIFEKTGPTLGPDKKSIMPSAENPGVVVFNHN